MIFAALQMLIKTKVITQFSIDINIVYFRIHMQEHRFPPLPLKRPATIDSRLLEIIKITKPEPTARFRELTKTENSEDIHHHIMTHSSSQDRSVKLKNRSSSSEQSKNRSASR